MYITQRVTQLNLPPPLGRTALPLLDAVLKTKEEYIMQKRAARRGTRALAFLLCLLMVVSLLPVMGASAAEGVGGNEVSPAVPAQVTNGLTLNKTLTEDTNGNYRLVLEAYATGAVTSTTSTTPTDVVLLLDVSGSMENSISDNDRTTRIAALQNAAKLFIDKTAEKNAAITDSTQQHRISIVKFAGTEKDTIGNDTYEGKNGRVTYTSNNTQIVKGLTVVNENGKTELEDAVNALTVAGATSADYGLNRAEAALQNSGDGRAKVIVLFTDGEPNHYSGFDTEVAAAAVNKAKTLKDAGTTIFTVSVLDSSDPTQNPTDYSAKDMNKYMQAVSSNYPNATATSQNGRDSWDSLTFNTGNYQAGYYKKASNSAELTDIFEEISNSVGGTTVTLDGNAVLRDIISSDFTLPEGFNSSNVKVETAEYQGNGQFATPVSAANGITATVNGKTVDVTGFSYKDHYVVDGSSDGQVQTGGQKLIVTIDGLIPVDSKGTDIETYSNEAESGIYTAASDTEPFVPFNQPWTKIPVYTKVLDFSMTANIAAAVQQLSKNSKTYGNFELKDETLTYKLGTRVASGNLVFDGVDSALFYGDYNGDNDNLSRWNKVNVIPANNVYFDDDLLNVPSDFNDDDYGYDAAVESVDYDVDNLDASVTKTLTFTGTGIDVYCTTESNSGSVYAKLRAVGADGNVINSLVTDKAGNTVMDGSMNNTYDSVPSLINVPTLSFTGLNYGTYQLTIRTGNNTNYKLDGVRIYNPANDDAKNVAAESGVDVNAQFVNVRDTLLSATPKALTEGAVYVDHDHETEDISVYEKIGPKNEVYLAQNQMVGFQLTGVPAGAKVLVGLSAPENQGSATAKVTYGNEVTKLSVNSAIDMYYPVTVGDNGYVVIENTSNVLLSVTNVQISGGDSASNAILMSSPELMSYMAEFDSLEVVQPEPEPTPDPEPTVNNNTVSAIIHAIWTQVMDGIGKLFGRL